MNIIGLQYLTIYCEAYIQVPPSYNYVNSTSFPDKTISIGTIEAWIHDHPKVLIKFHCLEGINSNESNLFYSTNNNYFLFQNNILKNIIDKINNFTFLSYQLPNMNYINNVLFKNGNIFMGKEEELATSFKLNDNSIEKPQESEQKYLPNEMYIYNKTEKLLNSQECKITSLSNFDAIPSKPIQNYFVDNITGTRRKIKFDSKNEIPILENFFKVVRFPNTSQLEELANFLNFTSNRSSKEKITLKNLKYWFAYRRVKEKRCRNNFK
ncbi:Homeobox domain and Homeodomain-like-containing protein [Strongyloides ratti]|uniref:Homeobox domain and Homeodomain-like-containing protein n=1 Tax=Strongyloides ratti TaxID=34506 RepID=A0A090KXK1_STRRB|nr:Homeobox domain and Homeodomain-like-containing protein [Strongyloides ratti]CEF62141.1 Homeobox domain and Homeodomain-like-containing protein [Strongyloides ratti]